MFDKISIPTIIKIKVNELDPVTLSKGLVKPPKNIAHTPLSRPIWSLTPYGNMQEKNCRCASSLAPIPFGFDIDATVFDDTLVNKMKKMSPEHDLWAKYICDVFEQNESGGDTATIAKRIIISKITKKNGNPCRTTTKGIRDIFVPVTAPFIETSSVTKKYPKKQAILCTFFVHNPTPAVRPFGLMRTTMMMTKLDKSLFSVGLRLE
jgi:hypothetical protein